MSKTKFTLGPWWIDGQGIGPKSFADDQSYGITMPVAYIEEYDWPENHVDNAHLIAAAPTMYEVLDWLDRRGGLGLEVHAVISTALAQARGEA
jgi:hypothetical protein